MYFNNFYSSEKDATWKDKKSKAASKNDEGKHIDQNLFKDTEVIPFDKRNDKTTAKKQLLPIVNMIQWIALVLVLAQCIVTKQTPQV